MIDNYVGKSLNEAVEDLSVTRTPYRILKEDGSNILTSDYQPERYNLYVDKNLNIVRVEMG